MISHVVKVHLLIISWRHSFLKTKRDPLKRGMNAKLILEVVFFAESFGNPNKTHRRTVLSHIHKRPSYSYCVGNEYSWSHLDWLIVQCMSDDELMRHSFDLVISKYWANVVNGRANSESNEEYFVSGLEKPWLVKWIVLEGGEDHLKFSEFFHLQRIWFLSWLIDLPD